MKVFTGVKNMSTLHQELTETIFTHRSMMEEVLEDVGDEDVLVEEAGHQPTLVLVELQVGPCVHPAQFQPHQQLHDLLQYVADRTDLKIGELSLGSALGTDLTLLWDSFTLQQVGMQGERKVKLRIARM